MPRVLIFAIFTFALCSSFTQNEKLQTEYCVINIEGTDMYKNPSFNSPKTGKLNLGDSFIVWDVINTNENKIIDSSFSLAGDWIKINWKGIDSYVFSADLSNQNPMIIFGNNGHLGINLRGKLISTDEREIDIDGFSSIMIEEKYVEMTYNYIAFDNCFDHIHTYYNLNFNEVYFQMASDYGFYYENEKRYSPPPFIEKIENKFYFEGDGATQDLNIQIKENEIVVSSYDCT